MNTLKNALRLAAGLVLIGLTAQADLNSAKTNLWAARWKYRHDFVEPNGAYSGSFDRLRANWTAANYDVRNVLLSARNEFIAEANNSGSQEARGLVAESVNELLSGHLSDGNYLLIEALKARYPFLGAGGADPGRPATDTWATKTNGSVDAEVLEIDKAVIEFGIGLKSATLLFNRADVVFDRYTHQGILRAADPDDFYAGYPYFTRLNNGFHNPTASFALSTPTNLAVQVELAQVTATAERRAQALFEKGQRYFQTSGQKTGAERTESRNKARQTLKVGHHSSYLLAAALGALQTENEFGQNKGGKITDFTSQMRLFYRNLDDPDFQPAGNTDQFIPPTDVPVTAYIEDARAATLAAIASEIEYRSQTRDNNTRQVSLQEFYSKENDFLTTLKRFTGFTDPEIQTAYGRLATIENQRAFRDELERRVKKLLDSYDSESGQVTNVVALGDFGVQILSVLSAQIQVQEAYNTLQNIPRRMQIEQDRSSSVIQITYSATEQVNATEEILAHAGSFSVGASVNTGVPPSIGASVNFNPLSPLVAKLQRERNSIQAHQTAQIEGANSAAAVRNILLEMDNAILELQRSKVLFDQENTKLGLLFADLSKVIEDYSEAVQLRLNTGQLHFANPEYRRWLDESFLRAEARRREAIVSLYQLGRALEFWWTESYQNPIFNGVGQQGTALDRFNSENFPDLNSVFSISTANQCGDFYLLLKEWNDEMVNHRSPTHAVTQTRTYSLRDDIIFKDLASGGVSLNRRIRDFRDFLSARAFFGQGAAPGTPPGLRLEFPITLESLDARQDWNLRVAYRDSYPDGVQAGVRVQFETDSSFNGTEPDVQVDLTYFGIISTTTYFDDPGSPERSVIKWELPTPNTPFAENRDEMSCTVPASINGRTRVGNIYLCTSFRGKPIAATSWRLTLDPTRAINRLIDISRIRDIKLVVTESRGRPVDPVSGNAYVFPGL